MGVIHSCIDCWLFWLFREQYITESIIPIVKDTGSYSAVVLNVDKKETVSEFLYELIWSCFNDRFDEKYLISLLVNIQNVWSLRNSH